MVIVTTPDVIAVRDAFRRMKLLETIGVEKERLRLVVNRHRKSTFVSLPDIETNLGLQVVATVADDPATVEKATNEGKLIRDVNRKSDVARGLSNLVAVLTDETSPDEGPSEDTSKSGGFFSSLFSRG